MSRTVKDALRRSPTLFHAAKTVQSAGRAVRRTWWTVTRGGAIRRYLATHEVRKLQIGAGQFPTEGWINTDLDPTVGVVFLDATRRLPFADATFDYVFSEHVIEHVPHDTARALLAECHRVLKPGGRIRIATPDLGRLAAMHARRGNPSPEEAGYVRWIAESFLTDPARASAAFALNQAFHGWGHEFLYDEETLTSALRAAGFAEPARYAVGVSDDPHLRGLETHGRAVGNEAMVAWETMVVEARRSD